MTDTPQNTDTPATPAPEDKATNPATQPAADTPAAPAASEPKQTEPAPKAPEPAAKPEANPAAKAAETKPEAKQAGTVLDDGDTQPAPEPVDWPSDWRERLAGDDKKMLSTLKRYTSPKTFTDAYFAMRQKMSSGEFIKALPENASEEDLAEYRKTAGIPESPDKYELKLADGLVVGENDRPVVDDFLKQAHAANLTEAQVNQTVQWYFQAREQEQAELSQRNEQKKEETSNALRQEWGNDYLPNKNLISGYLDTLGADAKAALLSARDADGTMLMNNPAVLKALAQTAREINPAATVVSATGANAISSINDEIAALEKRQREDWKGYFKDGAAQSRYGELLVARDKLAARG